jgi:hypothetical protein
MPGPVFGQDQIDQNQTATQSTKEGTNASALRGYIDTIRSRLPKEANKAIDDYFHGRTAGLDLSGNYGKAITWLTQAGMDDKQAAAFIDGIKSLYGHQDNAEADTYGRLNFLQNSLGKDWAPKGYQPPDQGAGGNTGAPDPNSIDAQIQAYINGLQGPATNDPVYQSLYQSGNAQGQQQASQAGIQGGYSQLMGQRSAGAAALPYLQQRQNLALQGMSLLNQRDIGLKQYGLNALQVQNGITQQNYGMAQNQAAGPLSAGLGLVGTLASAYTGVPGLGAAGSSLGAGLGASTVQAPTLQSVPGYGSGRGGNFSGGFSGRNNPAWS